MLSDKVEFKPDDYKPLRTGGYLAMGENLDFSAGHFARIDRFAGDITQFGIWEKVLMKQDIRDMSDCKVYLIQSNSHNNLCAFELDFHHLSVPAGGAYLMNSFSKWISRNVELQNEKLDAFCIKSNLSSKIFHSTGITHDDFRLEWLHPTPQSLHHCLFRSFCTKLRGSIPVPRTPIELTQMHDKLKSSFEEIGASDCIRDDAARFHLGIEMSSGSWQDPYHDESIDLDALPRASSASGNGKSIGSLTHPTSHPSSSLCYRLSHSHWQCCGEG